MSSKDSKKKAEKIKYALVLSCALLLPIKILRYQWAHTSTDESGQGGRGLSQRTTVGNGPDESPTRFVQIDCSRPFSAIAPWSAEAFQQRWSSPLSFSGRLVFRGWSGFSPARTAGCGLVKVPFPRVKSPRGLCSPASGRIRNVLSAKSGNTFSEEIVEIHRYRSIPIARPSVPLS
jgi:hypothetical protein